MPESSKKVSFRTKTETKCPVCKVGHAKEELLSGGGRLIAGNVTEELRRLYQPSRKWGTIYPLAYSLQVCPKCLYAAYPKDFSPLSEAEASAMLNSGVQRKKVVQTLFGEIDFKNDRDLVLGAASFILAVDCYHLRDSSCAPTPKKTLSSLRAAWLLDDLFAQVSERPYDKARDFYYIEAARGYGETIELMQSGAEPIDSVAGILGPDLDHNWGFDGINYLNAYLTKKYIDHLAESKEHRIQLLENSKRFLSKLYGMGKSSRSKPSMIIDMAKDLYNEMGEILDQLKES